uniref:BPSL0761 family protein n=1 Tax=Caballeronia sp. LjRoot34 TaxID=3342325 RepID=UPI003F4FEEBA
MTIPLERSRSVLRAYELLSDLANACGDVTLATYREQARSILRHYPERCHLRISAAKAPEIWADPDARWYD